MSPPFRSVSAGWVLATVAGLGLLVLAASPPVVGSETGAFIRHAFSAVCHQLPGRTPHMDGEALALCHRCIGVLAGLAGGLVLAPLLGGGRLTSIAGSAQGRWLVAAAAPTAVDWLVGVAGLWANTPVSRSVTGAVFGMVAGSVLAANLLVASRTTSAPPINLPS